MPRRSLMGMLVMAASLAHACRLAHAETPQPTPPYPPSPAIKSISWDFKSLVRLAPGSDLWPVTWADDGHLYASWGDGGGFGGTNADGRASLGFARIEGNPPAFKAVNVWGGKNAEHPATFKGKCAGMLCVGGVLYAWINVQNATPPDHRLAWSSDHGAHWELAEWAWPGSGKFLPATFLNFGQDYAGARDDYVYTYGGAWLAAPDHHLVRVPKNRIRDRVAYEFFKGLGADGRPQWTPDLAERRPVLHDPNGLCHITSIVYHPGIKRYLATTSHGMDRQVGRLAVFDAPEPWGPWTTVAYETNWGGFDKGETLVYALPTKWVSADGATMWCVFSSTGVLDSFNLVKATLTLHGRPQVLRSPRADAGPMPGQIAVDPKNPAWLVRYDPQGNHQPFFLCGPGDPEGFLYRGRRNADGTRDGDQMALIEKLRPSGANSIYLMAVRSHGGDGDRTHNPFVDNDPAKGLGAKVLDQWETWFSAMDEAGICIFLFIYDDSADPWRTGDRVGDPERQFLCGLVARFMHHKNLIWCIAEEYREKLSPRRAAAIAAAIREADIHQHPIAIHQNSGLRFDFPDDPNIDQFAIQYNVKTAEDLHAGMVKAFKDAAGRYNLNMSEAADHGTGETMRKKNWAVAMGGAYVMVFEMDIASTTESDLRDCGRMVRFFEATDFQTMAPHDELAHAATEYVLARPGVSYIAYASKRSGPMGLKAMKAGRYDLAWIDCASGKTVVQHNVEVAGGDQNLSPPDGISAECAVHVRRRP
jgi:hypothetical protein